jgi:hypothetical protein
MGDDDGRVVSGVLGLLETPKIPSLSLMYLMGS